jgi:putative ATP-dependent endonuclease of OLD family
VIISTHSPYLAAESKLTNLRSLVNLNSGVQVKSLGDNFTPEDLNKLQRDVMRFRGELLFSKAIILFEGVTEEQLAPVFFEKYFGFSCYSVGVNCISVAGKNYPPFIKMACSLGVPVYIVSDNDGNTKTAIESQISNIGRDLACTLTGDIFDVSFLNDGCDIENELVSHVGMLDELKDSLVKLATNGSENPQFIAAKQREMDQLDIQGLLARLRSAKSGYSGFLAGIVIDSEKVNEELIPQAFIDAFEAIKRWSVL